MLKKINKYINKWGRLQVCRRKGTPCPIITCALVYQLHLILSKAQDGLQLDSTSHQIPPPLLLLTTTTTNNFVYILISMTPTKIMIIKYSYYFLLNGTQFFMVRIPILCFLRFHIFLKMLLLKNEKICSSCFWNYKFILRFCHLFLNRFVTKMDLSQEGEEKGFSKRN